MARTDPFPPDPAVTAWVDAQPTEAPPLPRVATEVRVPVPGGSIRVLHHRPATAEARRPVVLVPGFGATVVGWHPAWTVLHERAELFYVETREKSSSRLDGAAAVPPIRMEHLVGDLAAALDHLGLHDAPCVTFGACWGGTTLLAGLATGRLHPRTPVAWDPPPRIFPLRTLIKTVGTYVPVPILEALRVGIGGAILANMKEPAQKARSEELVQNADWRFISAARSQLHFDLAPLLPRVNQPVLVGNGSHDRFHPRSLYPDVARRIPGATFLRTSVSEDRRERLMGLVALELARQAEGAPLPERLAGWALDPAAAGDAPR